MPIYGCTCRSNYFTREEKAMTSWGKHFVLGFICISFILSGCGGGGGGDSSPAAPGAPTGVTAVAGPGQARISWDNVAGATSYNIYHSTTSPVSKATGTKIPDVTNPNVVTPLANNVTTYFVVTAVNAIGESKDSIQVSATPVPNPPPAVPTSVSAAAGNGQVTISWNNVTGATSYNIYHSTTSPVSKATGTKVSVVTSPGVVTPLDNGTTYYFVVTAANADGESADSSEVFATPTANPPPAPPTGVSAAPGPAQATINWSAVAGATSYHIYYSTTSPVTKATGIKILGATSPSVVPSLTRGTQYNFVVTAASADGESAESSEVTATPNPPNPTFSQGDLTGTWNVQVILTGAKPGWYRYTAVVDGAGNVTISSPSSSSGSPIPTVPAWSITPGTGFDNTTGVVTETGTGRNTTFQAKMSSNKYLMVGNSTYGPGTFAEHIFLKRSGATYTDADLANKTIAYNRIFTGASKTWEIASGSINASNQLTLTSKQDSSGVLTPPPANFAEIHVDSAGIVTIGNESNFIGMMSVDKKVIAGTSTDDDGKYSLRIIQLRGQTYTSEDLVGVYLAYTFNSDQWARGTWTFSPTSPTSVTRVNVTGTNIVNSAGATVNLTPWTEIIDAQGGITLAPPGSSSSHGLISFWKDMVVYTGDRAGGASMTITMQ